MNEEKIFVVSLPRTGTTSLCKMLNILGYKAKHVSSGFYEKWVKDGYDAFADTPSFAPSFIEKRLVDNPNNKFIYINRNVEEWVESFESINLNGGYEFIMNLSDTEFNVIREDEYKAYGEVFGYAKKYDRQIFIQKFLEHKTNIKNSIPENQLLVYNFNDGWYPLIQFLNKDMPDVDIPTLNKNRRGDSYAIDISTEEKS